MPKDGQQKEDRWVVRDVPERTRRVVKAYAGRHGLTTAQALEFLVDTAMENGTARNQRWQLAETYCKRLGLPVPSPTEAIALLARAAEIQDQIAERGVADTTGVDMQAMFIAGLIVAGQFSPDDDPA